MFISSTLRFFTILITTLGVATAQAGKPNLSKRFVPTAQTASLTGTWALWHNPAGLAFFGGGEGAVHYLYEWSNLGNRHHGGGSLAYNWMNTFALAGGLTTQAAFVDKAKNNLGTDLNGIFGGAVRMSNYASFGISFLKSHNFLLQSSTPMLIAFGLQLRPAQFLALGGHYEEVDGAYFAAPNITAGISLRPYKEFFTIGVDNRFVALGKNWEDGFRYHPIFTLKSQFRGYGASVSAEIPGLRHGFYQPIFSLMLDLNLEHLGFSFAGAVNTAEQNFAVGSMMRASTDEWQSIAPPKDLWVELTIDQEGRLEQKPKSLVERLFSIPDDPLAVLLLLKRIELDARIAHVVLNLNGFGFGDARTQEWRNAIVSLRDAGKEVIVYLDGPSERDYYIASAANRIHMNQYSSLRLGNFQTTLTYFADLFEKIGIKAQSVEAGDYKTAPRQWTHARPQKEEIEVANNILNTFLATILDEISLARNIERATVKALFDRGEITAVDAKNAGLIDELTPPKTFEQVNTDENRAYFTNYDQVTKKQERFHPPKKIVVLPIVDTIADDRALPGVFSWLFPVTGAKDIIDDIEDAVRDPEVIGIILRIDSPGGDAIAGHRISDALKTAQKIKPIVASMSDVAASAGYMIAVNTHRIVAQPSTITGSIGVFSLMFSGEHLAKKLGIFTKELSPLKNPGPTIYRQMTQSERDEAQRITDWFYQNFIEMVSVGLNVDKKEIEKVASGRVWLGQEAFERKLIHEIGGFADSVDIVRELAEIPKDDDLVVEIRTPAQRKGFSLTSNLSALFQSKRDQDKEMIKALASPYLQALEAYRINGVPQARLRVLPLPY